jgi:ketosteroid isomerase-like protein
MRRSILLAATLLAAGCQQARPGNTAAPADTAAIADTIRAQETQWAADYAARNADAIVAHYAPDGALASPGAALAVGPEAIRAADREMLADPNFQLQFGADRILVAASGDLASSRGHFTLRVTDPASRQPVTMTGTYLTVWQKQADGSWKAAEDIITPGPAPAAPPAVH